MKLRAQHLVLAGLLVLGVAWFFTSTTITDTEEDIWPDPRARQAVHMRVLGRRLQAAARYDGGLPDSLTQPWPTDSLFRTYSVDLWGTRLVYLHRDSIFFLRSAGPDKQFGSSDDVTLCDGTTYEAKVALAEGGLAPFCRDGKM